MKKLMYIVEGMAMAAGGYGVYKYLNKPTKKKRQVSTNSVKQS